jgi:hypothetical protein
MRIFSGKCGEKMRVSESVDLVVSEGKVRAKRRER